MAVRKAQAMWEGSLKDGRGKLKVASGALEADYSYQSRFEHGPGTNPEELIGAAHAGCFSMAFSGRLTKAGFEPKRIQTEARVQLDKLEGGFSITHVYLDTVAEVPGIDERTFQEAAQAAKDGCPVSMALTGVKIHLSARLVQ
jgi:osmotically inducible protein OsmC